MNDDEGRAVTFIVQAARSPCAKHTTIVEVSGEHRARDLLRRMLDAGPRHLVYRLVPLGPDGCEGVPLAVMDLRPYTLRRRPRT